MNFFERQDQARRSTVLFVLLFLLTIAATVAAVYPLTLAVLYFVKSFSSETYTTYPAQFMLYWDPVLFVRAAAGVGVLVILGALYKMMMLSQGGRSVAEMLGGVRISPDTQDPDLRKVLNVVEEMAIASGTAVPPVYLLANEKGINAFAAGYSPRDAVIGVTQGAVDLLTREELQGVIAHEFSHILNGDMRLNLHLMSGVNGLLLLAILGRQILRSMRHVRSGGGRKGGSGIVIILIAGLGLWLIGLIGVLFARILKCAIARERERLADASAVQFTRYPEGLTGAFKKIGGLQYGSLMDHPKAEEASHFYFSQGLKLDFLSALFSTHPPLVERIRAWEPSFDGKFPQISRGRGKKEDGREKPLVREAARQGREKSAPAAAFSGAQGSAIIQTAGKMTEMSLAYAGELLDLIPDDLKMQTRDPAGAEAVVFALLLERERESIRKVQREYLFLHVDMRATGRLHQILKETDKLDARFRLPLLDMSIPALSLLSDVQYRNFRTNLEHLILADQTVRPHELALELLVIRHLNALFPGAVSEKNQGVKLPASEALAVILSLCARAAGQSQIETDRAFREGAMALGISQTIPFIPAGEERPRLFAALRALEGGSYAARQELLEACAAAAQCDGKIRVEEMEMIRAVSDALDCPLPPLPAVLA